MRKIYLILIFLAMGGMAMRASSAFSAELKVGDPAPDFSTVDDLGLPVSLKDFRGKTVILYFYPKDDTPGCTAEAKNFGASISEFEGRNAVILGVSYDTVSSHKEFKEKYKIPFRLLVDSDRKIAEAYGAKGAIFASRDTIIIDPQGRIKNIYRSVDPRSHVQDVLKDLP
jgi:thioredoxin-dependent peroxiredoxin